MEDIAHWIGWIVLLILSLCCSFWTLACSVFSSAGNEGKFFLAGAALFWVLTIKCAPFVVMPV